MKRLPTTASFGVRPVGASGTGWANATDAAKNKGSQKAALAERPEARSRITSSR
jgi:hypothetical protein